MNKSTIEIIAKIIEEDKTFAVRDIVESFWLKSKNNPPTQDDCKRAISTIEQIANLLDVQIKDEKQALVFMVFRKDFIENYGATGNYIIKSPPIDFLGTQLQAAKVNRIQYLSWFANRKEKQDENGFLDYTFYTMPILKHKYLQQDIPTCSWSTECDIEYEDIEIGKITGSQLTTYLHNQAIANGHDIISLFIRHHRKVLTKEHCKIEHLYDIKQLLNEFP